MEPKLRPERRHAMYPSQYRVRRFDGDKVYLTCNCGATAVTARGSEFEMRWWNEHHPRHPR